MRLNIQPTDKFVSLGGVVVRVWSGQDEQGAEVLVFVRAVASEDEETQARLEKELHEVRGCPDSTLAMLDRAFAPEDGNGAS